MLLLQSQPVCLVSQSDLNYCVCHWGASRLLLPSILRYLQSDEHRSIWGQCWMHLQSNGFRICCRFNKSTLLSRLCQLPPSATTWQSIMARRANGTILLTHYYLSFVNVSGKLWLATTATDWRQELVDTPYAKWLISKRVFPLDNVICESACINSWYVIIQINENWSLQMTAA